jgi:hypothetical protein
MNWFSRYYAAFSNPYKRTNGEKPTCDKGLFAVLPDGALKSV